MVVTDFEPKIRATLYYANKWIREHGFQPLSTSEEDQILHLVDQSIKKNCEEENPIWELPWIIADAYAMLRRIDLPTCSGGRRE